MVAAALAVFDERGYANTRLVDIARRAGVRTSTVLEHFATKEDAFRDPELAAIVRLIIAELPRFPELAVFHATEALERFYRTLERNIEHGIERGELRPIDVRAAGRTILATLAEHALWFAYPAIYGGITGADRERAVATTIDTLIGTLGPVSPPDRGRRLAPIGRSRSDPALEHERESEPRRS